MATKTINDRAQIAVLMTCYNRKNITLDCLKRLKQQNASYDIYLVDDGSSDETAEAVSQEFPQVNIIKGDGNLFWGGGMRLAFGTAMAREYEYYLWLNDDTILKPNTFSKLLGTHKTLSERGYQTAIVAGSVIDPETGELTYGGRVPSKRLLSFKFDSVEPDTVPQECSTMQGNCVLIPASVAKIVGNIDSAFVHNMGDLDYGLRARKLGCSVWIAPGYIGTCSKNLATNSWADSNLSPIKRLRIVLAPKGFPIKARAIYTKRHKGMFWIFYWVLPYIRALIGYKNLNSSACFKAEKKITN